MRAPRRACAVFLALLAWVAQGCASRPAPGIPPGGDFLVSGKMAVVAPTGNLSARFRWSQAGDRYDLELWGPFGQGRRRLTGNDQYLSLLDGSGNLLLRGPVQAVMLEQLGFEVPLTSLAYWIQGEPDPDQRVLGLSRDTRGEVANFNQLDWQISYPDYMDVPPDRRLPGRIEATSPQYRIKLAISRWEV